jgi:thioredoxin reductase (NADPH)
LIVGAGPGGISASLRAIENKLNYVTLERDEIGGTVAKFPHQKLVMTSPVEFPIYGKFKKRELSKENLLAFWDMVLNRSDFNAVTGEKVDDIRKGADGIFTVITPNNQYRSRAVVPALGRNGTPRKLGVRGEELSKVMYRLIEADHYIDKKILVVGGGDSAVEAAMGLAHQHRNQVTLSYRKGSFSRIKERNANRVEGCILSGKLKVLFNSNPVEFRPDAVILAVNGAKPGGKPGSETSGSSQATARTIPSRRAMKYCRHSPRTSKQCPQPKTGSKACELIQSFVIHGFRP